MRKFRENLPNRVYHLISRVAHRAFFLNAEERTRFVELLKRVAAFSGVELLAYCVMTNHVHILVFVPEPEGRRSPSRRCGVSGRTRSGSRAGHTSRSSIFRPWWPVAISRLSTRTTPRRRGARTS